MSHSITAMPLEGCWAEVADALNAGIDRLILFGPPGTGKTYAGLNYGEVERGAHRLVCTDDMTNADVTGAWMPNASGTWTWHEGAAVRAWSGDGEKGGRLVVDEIDKAGGDVFATLLAMTDTADSAEWSHPSTNEIVRPLEGYSVVMTTNVEDMDDLPTALKDRFPVAIRIDRPHPAALEKLSYDLRAYAVQMADAGHRRLSLRSFYAFDKLRKALGDEKAAHMVFGSRGTSILDAIRIDKVS
jgi:MoxR-like ATPase